MLCAVCQNQRIHKAFVKQGKEFLRCASCGLVFRHPAPSPLELKELYDKSYYAPWQIGEGKMSDISRLKTATFLNWIGMIEAHAAKGRILDIGCAMGFFLEVAKARGWDPYGIEVSEYAQAIARQEFGDRILQADLLEVRFGDEFFDAVTLFDVIEHGARPLEMFREIGRILKPGGVVALSTMNTRSLSSKLMGRRWPQYKPEHLTCFSHTNIRLALEGSGFEVLEIKKAKKILNLRYIHSYFRTYPAPVLTGLSGLAVHTLPRRLAEAGMTFGCGEMLVIAKKRKN